MKKNILLFYPHTANRAVITSAIPILCGIAKKRNWNVSYFDTSFYEKPQDATEEKELTGSFKPGFTLNKTKLPPIENIVIDLQEKIDNLKPDVLAVTAMSCDFQNITSFLPKIKIPNNTISVVGGIHSIVCPEEVINTKLFDLVCIGQGEQTFDEILAKIEQQHNITNIKGTWFYNKTTTEIIQNPNRNLLTPDKLWNVDTDYSIFNKEYFSYPFDGTMINMFWMEVARGCPYNCTYCGNSVLKNIYKGLGQYLCTRPLDSIFNQMQKMVNTYKIDIFNITDECFLAHPKKWLKEFANQYSTNIRKPFLIQTRPETVTEENIKILLSCDAPFFQVGMGVESGSEKILVDVCNRKTKIKDIINAYDLLNKYHIRSNAYFMIGFPFETREDIFKTIELCKRINSTINVVSIFQPLPGQPLTKLCIKEGFITGYEQLGTFTSNSVLKMPQITKEEISNLRRTFMLYAKLPKEYYPEIEKCEKDFKNNIELFNQLLSLRWKHDSIFNWEQTKSKGDNS